MTPSSMQQYIASHGNAWAAIVSIAFQCGPEHVDREAEILAKATGATKATIKRKFQAVHHKREQGWNEKAIAAAGQGTTLSAFAASRKAEKQEPDTILRYRVSRSLADEWCRTVKRLEMHAELKTSDDLIEFLNACFADLSHDEIQNLAGTKKAY